MGGDTAQGARGILLLPQPGSEGKAASNSHASAPLPSPYLPLKECGVPEKRAREEGPGRFLIWLFRSRDDEIQEDNLVFVFFKSYLF